MAPKKRAGGGKKSFMKGVSRSDEADTTVEEAQQPVAPEAVCEQAAGDAAQPSASPAPPTACTPAAAAAPPGVEPAVKESPAAASELNATTETRGQMLQRHKKEVKSMKEIVKKMGKKMKDEAATLEGGMEVSHALELADLESRAAAEAQQDYEQQTAVDGAEEKPEDAVAAALAGNSLYAKTAAAEKQEASRAQKRRQKVAAQGAERESRIAAELAEAGDSQKQLEEAALRELLVPLGYAVRDIQPDGNCMYRAVEDQLRLQAAGDTAGEDASAGHVELRQRAVEHMRAHEPDFLPFFAQEGEDEAEEGGNVHDQFEQYCSSMSAAAAWGSQLELGALAHSLARRIEVFSVGLPTVMMGEAYGGEPLRVCYLRHAYGMGEHYNSVGAAGDGELEHQDVEADNAQHLQSCNGMQDQ